MPQKTVFVFSELLENLLDSNIISKLQSAFDNSSAPNKLIVKERGLRYRIIRTATQETLTKRVVAPVPSQPVEQIFDVVFLLD